jgi:hypothetical protein
LVAVDLLDLVGMTTLVLILALMLMMAIVFITGILALLYGGSLESLLS